MKYIKYDKPRRVEDQSVKAVLLIDSVELRALKKLGTVKRFKDSDFDNFTAQQLKALQITFKRIDEI